MASEVSRRCDTRTVVDIGGGLLSILLRSMHGIFIIPLGQIFPILEHLVNKSMRAALVFLH